MRRNILDRKKVLCDFLERASAFEFPSIEGLATNRRNSRIYSVRNYLEKQRLNGPLYEQHEILLHDCVVRLIDDWSNRICGRDSIAAIDFYSKHPDSYYYIPADGKVFLETVTQLYETHGSLEGLRFVDVGCGIGAKVLAASFFGMKSAGVEFNPALVSLGKQLFRMSNDGETNRIILGDVMNHDYSEYDVAFVNLPFINSEKEMALEDKIADEMKVGACFLFAHHPPILRGFVGTNRCQFKLK